MTDAGNDATGAHRAFAVAAFNSAWELIDSTDRSADDDRRLLTLAFAARWHWGEIGTVENRTISDWQVAHAASLVGETRLAQSFARAAYDSARSADLPSWLQASTAEGMARAAAAAGDTSAYEQYAEEARRLVDTLDDPEDRELIGSQLASIPRPTT